MAVAFKEHTADVSFTVTAGTREDLFSQGVEALMQVLKPKLKESKGQESRREIFTEHVDSTSLFIEFLTEVLYLAETHRERYVDVEIAKLTDTQVVATLMGEKIEGFDEVIKGVTYHGAELIQKIDGTWEITVILDV